MNYNFLDFTREHYPKLWEEFYRYKRKEIPPAIGTEVTTLRNGFNGWAGVKRYVVAYDDKRYVALSETRKGRATSLCPIETWWKDLEIINEPEINV